MYLVSLCFGSRGGFFSGRLLWAFALVAWSLDLDLGVFSWSFAWSPLALDRFLLGLLLCWCFLWSYISGYVLWFVGPAVVMMYLLLFWWSLAVMHLFVLNWLRIKFQVFYGVLNCPFYWFDWF